MKKKILKVLFLIKGRKRFVKRYLDLLNYYNSNQSQFDLLIIKDVKENFFKYDRDIKCKLILKESGLKKPIKGINDIFRSILINSKITEKYKYLLFIEDDNFVFPEAILNCKKFLENNPTFISCNGKSFLFTKNKKYNFLNFYNLPITLQSMNYMTRAKQFGGGIFYYSLFKSIFFIKILKNVVKIDNNLSEIFFNFQALKYGKHKRLNNFFLAREYPRPTIYNIPNTFIWLQYKNLLDEKKIISKILIRNLKKKDKFTFLILTLYKYFYHRVYNLEQNKRKFSKKKIVLNHFILNFLKLLNK